MAQIALRRPDDRMKVVGDYVSELLSMDEPRRRLAAEMSGLDIRYDLGEGHALLGRRMPDLDLVTANGPLRLFTLLRDARPVLLNLGEPGGFDITPWADRVRLIGAKYAGTWELPAIGAVTAPTAVLIRPDGYVAWAADLTRLGLADALTAWFGPPVRHSAPAPTIILSGALGEHPRHLVHGTRPQRCGHPGQSQKPRNNRHGSEGAGQVARCLCRLRPERGDRTPRLGFGSPR